MIPVPVLDLCPITEGNAATSFRNSMNLLRHAKGLGFNRDWLAEDRNMPDVAVPPPPSAMSRAPPAPSASAPAASCCLPTAR